MYRKAYCMTVFQKRSDVWCISIYEGVRHGTSDSQTVQSIARLNMHIFRIVDKTDIDHDDALSARTRDLVIGIFKNVIQIRNRSRPLRRDTDLAARGIDDDIGLFQRYVVAA